jgi:hypothetical protein
MFTQLWKNVAHAIIAHLQRDVIKFNKVGQIGIVNISIMHIIVASSMPV